MAIWERVGVFPAYSHHLSRARCFGLAGRKKGKVHTMKKVIVVLLVALLAIALVACGGDTTTTTPAPAGTSGNTPAGSSTPAATNPTETSNAPESTNPPATDAPTTGPVTPGPDDPNPTETGYDIAYGTEDYDYACLATLNGCFCQFEYGFGLGACVVIQVGESIPGVYNDLVWHTDEGWLMNPDYTWQLTIDGQNYTITQFSLFNEASDATSNWIRMGLGKDFPFNTTDVNEDGAHGYVIRLEIRGVDGKIKYYADLSTTEEEMLEGGSGPCYYTPVNRDMVTDPTRTGTEVTDITFISGPTAGPGETAQYLFDGDTSTKLCTSDESVGVVFTTGTTPVTLTGISLVNANDNDAFSSRTIVAFTLYGSNDGGSTWEEILVVVPAEGFDKATVSTNYLERYFAINTDKSYTYFKFESQNGEMYQLSELLLWN